MRVSPLALLRAGPPPPRVALLSDAVFFTRLVPVLATATAAEVAAQVELALEALSPFPVAQIYHGHYWKPGLNQAFVFASYRRRFPAEQTKSWPQAEVVLPVFASVFGAEVAPATTLMLAAPEGLTAVHWGESNTMPSRVLFRALAAEATPEERVQARDELLRAIGGSKTVVDLADPPAVEVSSDDDELIFRSGPVVSRLPVATAAALDVRDKAQLAEMRRAKVRDLWLWRTTMATAATIALLFAGELAMKAGDVFWQKPRLAKIKVQAPLVEKIDNAQKLVTRIEELRTNRLLPLEMIEASRKKPDAIVWTKITTSGLFTLVIDGRTNGSINDINVYRASLLAVPECENAEITRAPQLVNGVTTFTITVTFKPGALKPETPSA
jgi:hypothetical protein